MNDIRRLQQEVAEATKALEGANKEIATLSKIKAKAQQIANNSQNPKVVSTAQEILDAADLPDISIPTIVADETDVD